MRRYLVLVLVLALTACAPRLTATPEPDGEEVVIVLAAATGSLYAVTLSVLNATTEDPRCVTLGAVDLGCVIGDIPQGGETSVRVTPTGRMACAAFGFLDAEQGVGSYRPFTCEGGGS